LKSAGIFYSHEPFADPIGIVAAAIALAQNLSAYADALYSWNRTTANDQVIGSIGLFQQIKGWELHAGYRHLQTLGSRHPHALDLRLRSKRIF
jgi:hypothetical protein